MDCQERSCSLPVREAIEQPVKMRTRLVSAVPAVWFFFIAVAVAAVSVVDGQVPQQGPVKVQQLVEQLSHVEFDERELAEQQLMEIGSPAVDLLLEQLIDCNPDACSRIKRILQGCAEKCDEESLFKVLAVLRFRFEVADKRIEPMLQQWAFQRRADLIAAWRKQGVVVNDPFEMRRDALEAMRVMANRGQFRFAPGRPDLGFPQGGVDRIPTAREQLATAEPKPEEQTRSKAELIRFELEGTLVQNKKLVLNSKQGADGFAQKVMMAQSEPVTITIGENWKGDYSVFDFDEAAAVLPISGLELQRTEINDSVLSAIKKHPLARVVVDECSVATDLNETFPASVTAVVISGANAPVDMLKRVVSKESSGLNSVRIERCNFGKDEAKGLRSYRLLTNVEIVKIDIDDRTFDELAEINSLRRLWLEQCKFPASALIDFKRKRGSGFNVDFKAKAFLGVGPVTRVAARIEQGACVIANVVPGEAADRAGMELGDEIVKIGDQEIKNFDELRVAIAQYEIGEEVAVKVRRDGKELTLKAKLGTPPASIN